MQDQTGMKAMLHNSCATPFRNGKFIRTIAPDRRTARSPFTFPSSPFPLLKHQHASIRDPRCTAAWHRGRAGLNALRTDSSWQLDLIVTFNDTFSPGQRQNSRRLYGGTRRSFLTFRTISCSDVRPNQEGVRGHFPIFLVCLFVFLLQDIMFRVLTTIRTIY